MPEEVTLETQVRIDSLVREIAKRDYPPVFVVEEYSQEAKYMWSLEGYKLSDQRWIDLAKERDIPVLGGLDVIQHLRGEMDPSDEYMLRDQVLWVFAAKMGMMIVNDYDPYRVRLKGAWGEESVSVKMVSVDEVSPEEIEDWLFFETLEVTTRKWPNVFLIPPTDAVMAFLEEHGEHQGG
jgi:hypothetical protein